jgi:hypothetical protein
MHLFHSILQEIIEAIKNRQAAVMRHEQIDLRDAIQAAEITVLVNYSLSGVWNNHEKAQPVCGIALRRDVLIIRLTTMRPCFAIFLCFWSS